MMGIKISKLVCFLLFIVQSLQGNTARAVYYIRLVKKK
jgi:hypothetical protein